MCTPTLHRCLAIIAFALAAVTGPAQADDLVVSAASSLTNAFQSVATADETQHSGTHVVLNFASSDTLLRQIANGAPADVFASADQLAMDRAQAQGAILPGSRVDFAANQLVLIVPTGGAKIAALDDLTGTSFKRIAWGDPAEPGKVQGWSLTWLLGSRAVAKVKAACRSRSNESSASYCKSAS